MQVVHFYVNSKYKAYYMCSCVCLYTLVYNENIGIVAASFTQFDR